MSLSADRARRLIELVEITRRGNGVTDRPALETTNWAPDTGAQFA